MPKPEMAVGLHGNRSRLRSRSGVAAAFFDGTYRPWPIKESDRLWVSPGWRQRAGAIRACAGCRAHPDLRREPRNVRDDAAGLVIGQNLGLHGVGLGRAAIDVGKCLAVGIADNVATGDLLGLPGRRESAGGGHLLSIS